MKRHVGCVWSGVARTIEKELDELLEISRHQFPDRSARWLLRQREHLQALLEILMGPLVEAFDFAEVTLLNRSFIPDELRPQESDMVFRIPFRAPGETAKEVIVYLLIEHQSTVDREMELRLLSYMVQIWMEERRQWDETQHPQRERWLTPIVPIVFYTGKGEWKAPLSLTALMNIPEVLTRFVPTFDTLLLDVNATDPNELTQTGHPLGWLLTVLQHEDSEAPVMHQALVEALEGLADSQVDTPDQYIRAVLYIFLFLLHRRKGNEHQDLLHLLAEEQTHNREIIDMTESIIERIEQRGLQQGIEQGARQTSIKSTLAILNIRFPDADVETLTSALEAIDDINRLQQLILEASVIDTFRAFQERVEA